MRRSICLAIALATTMQVVSATGGELKRIRRENAQLRKRVGKLESIVNDLQKTVKQLSARPAGGTQLSAEEVEHLKVMSRSYKGVAPVTSGVNAELYGYIKADASWDSSSIHPGNYAAWADHEQFNSNDDAFNLTAKQSRFGVKFFGPESDSLKTSGRVEVDFYAAGAAENKGEMFMRHAYLNLEWPQSDFSLLAGQTWDVMSPLNPHTLNYSVQWLAGNYGYRRPQIRATKGFALDDDVSVDFAAAIARNIGQDGQFPADAGADSGLPILEGRAGISFPMLNGKATEIGISGHMGHEEYDTDVFGTNERYETWSACLDLTQPLNDWLAVKGEVFTGQNLSTFLGGIGQGVNTTAHKEIGADGGWVAAGIGPFDKWNFNVGTSMERVSQGDLSSATDRTFNRAVFGNVIYAINKHASVGFELSHWRTEYKDISAGDGIRAQTALTYKF